MAGIFISYRREDASGFAGRLFDSLRDHFGKERVFMDVAGSIEPGIDFAEAIEGAVGSCEALIVVIGKDWLTCTDESGDRRLDGKDDWIRLETATALRRNIRVIPVLVEGARMPGAEELPDDLKALARRQAIELSATRWDFDVEQLIASLKRVLEQLGEPPPDVLWKKGTFRTALALTVIAAVVVLAWQLWPSGDVQQDITLEEDVAVKVADGPEEDQGAPGTQTPGEEEKTAPPTHGPESTGGDVGSQETEGTTAGGARQATVPSVLGRPLEDAENMLAAVSLKVGKVQQQESHRRAGSVLGQDPNGDAQVVPGSAVDLVIATGRPATQQLKVPSVVGLTFKEAEAALGKSRLSVGKVQHLALGKTDPGKVYNQAPRSGSEATVGSTVDLYVEMGLRPNMRYSGTLYLSATEILDLDNDPLDADGRRNWDIAYRVSSGGRPYIEPNQGIEMAIVDRGQGTPEGCAAARLSASRIAITGLTARTIICVRTNRRHYALLMGLKLDQEELKLSFYTFN